MRKPMVLAGLFLLLGGCPSPDPVLNNSAMPSPTPTPTPWLTVDPVCTGQITRAEWLICDNPNLNALHRRLAQQWETARQHASEQRMQLLEDQLYALLGERDQCQDVPCVAIAYRRYIDGAGPWVDPTPKPKPSWTPKPKPTWKPQPKPTWKPRPRPQPAPDWNRDENEGPSCIATAGATEAQQLARQCDRVTDGRDWSCSPQRSCGTLRRNINRGCNETYRKPGFCPRL